MTVSKNQWKKRIHKTCGARQSQAGLNWYWRIHKLTSNIQKVSYRRGFTILLQVWLSKLRFTKGNRVRFSCVTKILNFLSGFSIENSLNLLVSEQCCHSCHRLRCLSPLARGTDVKEVPGGHGQLWLLNAEPLSIIVDKPVASYKICIINCSKVNESTKSCRLWVAAISTSHWCCHTLPISCHTKQTDLFYFVDWELQQASWEIPSCLQRRTITIQLGF